MDRYGSELFDTALEALPNDQEAATTAVGDYILLYRAKANLMAKQYKEALSQFRLLESRYPDSPLVRDAVLGQCQALLELNEPNPVLAVLGSHKSETSSEALYYQAKALDLAGEKEKAVALYLQIYSRYPESKYSEPTERSLVISGSLKGALNYDARLQRAGNLLKADNVRSARILLLALGRVNAPDSRSSQKRSVLMADVEYRLGKASVALSHLRNVTDADPELHARAIYLEGACSRKLDREQALIALRDKALKLYPLSADTETLCFSVATYYDVNYEPAKAREAYRILYKAFPKGRRAESALWKLCLFSYFEKQYSEAILGFWNYLLAYPDPLSASSALYWMGRCYEKLGDFQKAKYVYGKARELANDSYYGQRARAAEASMPKGANGASPVSGLDFQQVVATCDKIQLPPVQLPEPGEGGLRVIERVSQLVSAGLSDLALSELRYGIRRYPQDGDALCYIMARIYMSKDDLDGAIASLRRAFPDYNGRPNEDLPEEVWDLLFPVRHWGVISAQAAKTGLDPALILGVIRQESAFEVRARSKANARGLMQILPSTGRMLARQARVTHYSVNKLYQAETNIILGTRHLASLLQQYGKAELALAAYNAGDTRVDLWLNKFGDADMAEFVERIPFSETRGYIRQVLTNRIRYAQRTSSAAADN